MDLRHLRYFVAVAEERHFGRAAVRLGMAQPPLSRQIKALERELGVDLFDRRQRQIEVTTAGAALLVQARRVFEAVELAVHETRRASRGESGRIVVGYPSTFAYSGLPEIVRAFRAAMPRIEVVLRELAPQAQIAALRAREVDIGFVRGPFAEPGLVSELVFTEPLVAVLPRRHPLASRSLIPLHALATEPFVLFPRARGASYFDDLMRLCHAAGFTPDIVQEAPQLDILSLVAAGLGVSLVPLSLRKMRRSGVSLVPLAGAPRTELLAIWREGSGDAVVSAFLDAVRRHKPKASARNHLSQAESKEGRRAVHSSLSRRK